MIQLLYKVGGMEMVRNSIVLLIILITLLFIGNLNGDNGFRCAKAEYLKTVGTPNKTHMTFVYCDRHKKVERIK